MFPLDFFTTFNLASNYMLKGNNRNTRIKYEICSKLTEK